MRHLVLESLLSFARAIFGRKKFPVPNKTDLTEKGRCTVQDEVFHVRQAEAYLKGRWDVWDPKITTPPGLCVRSCIAKKLFSPVYSLQKS